MGVLILKYPCSAKELPCDSRIIAHPIFVEHHLNSNGKTINTYNDTTIDIQSLPKGIYFIHLKFPKESIAQKFIKI